MSKKKHRKYDEYALLNYGSDYDDCFEEDTYYDDTPPLSSYTPQVDSDEDSYVDIPTIDVPRNKKARAVRAFANRIAGDCHVKVLEHKELLFYDEKAFCYTPISAPLVFVQQVLGTKVWNLTQKDMSDIVQALFSDPDIQIAAEDVNADPYRINCLSGDLDWQTGQLREHSDQKLYTYCVDAYYLVPDERQGCPVFDQFCATSLQNDPAKRQQLLEVLGYILSDAVGAKSAFFLHGAPDSGKSILLNFASALLDKRLIVNIQLHQLNEKFKIAELLGKKINVAGEIKGSALRDISSFKSITGGDRMCGEFKGESPFYFTPTCKLLFAGNTLPETKDTDMTRSFVNRLCVVIFGVSIPKDKQDKNLLNKLLEERDEIFSLAMDALASLHKRNYQFTVPTDTQHFLNAYAETQSSVHAFLKDWCEIGNGGYVFSRDLCSAYREYCDLNGFDPIKNQAMQNMIVTLPNVSRERIRAEGKNLRGFRGLIVHRESRNAGTMEHSS